MRPSLLIARIAALSLVMALPIACLGDSLGKSPGVVIFSKASPSLVLLKTLGILYSGEQEISWGTGFVISEDGLILTCSHVVPDQNLYKSVERQAFFSDTAEQFEIVGRDTTTDLALIKLKSPRPLQALPIGDSDVVETGEDLYILGFPRNYSLSIVPGLLGNKKIENNRWLTQAPLNPGNSGGPALTQDGAVVAIAVGGVPKARAFQGGG